MSVPPPVASNARVADVAFSASTDPSRTSAMPNCRHEARRVTQQFLLFGLADDVDERYPVREQSLTSICPRFDAAAVCTKAE